MYNEYVLYLCVYLLIENGNNAINNTVVVIIIAATFLIIIVTLAISSTTIVVIVTCTKKRNNPSKKDITNSLTPVYETCNEIPIYESLNGEQIAYEMNEINGMEKNEGDCEPYVMSSCSAYEFNQN